MRRGYLTFQKEKKNFLFLKCNGVADNRCSAKLRSEASKFDGRRAPRRIQKDCERASNFAEHQDYEKFAERSGANLGKWRAEPFSS